MPSPLKPTEHQRIDAAITEIERRTATDFAVVVTRISDRYSLYPLVWAGLGALMVTGIAAIVRPELSIRAAIVIEVPALIVLTLVLDWLPIRLSVVPQSVKHAHARHLAHREFAAHVASGAPDRNAILLFVSLAERYVEIIADHKTHAMAPEGAWDKIVADFVATVKTGRVAGGIVAAIEACGTAMESHRPATNESR